MDKIERQDLSDGLKPPRGTFLPLIFPLFESFTKIRSSFSIFDRYALYEFQRDLIASVPESIRYIQHPSPSEITAPIEFPLFENPPESKQSHEAVRLARLEFLKARAELKAEPPTVEGLQNAIARVREDDEEFTATAEDELEIEEVTANKRAEGVQAMADYLIEICLRLGGRPRPSGDEYERIHEKLVGLVREGKPVTGETLRWLREHLETLAGPAGRRK
jgi:hypothetical protein